MNEKAKINNFWERKLYGILAHCVVWKNTLCSFSFSWIFLPSWMNECVHVQCETMSKISMKLKLHLKSYLIYHHIRNWFREPHFLKVFFIRSLLRAFKNWFLNTPQLKKSRAHLYIQCRENEPSRPCFFFGKFQHF